MSTRSYATAVCIVTVLCIVSVAFADGLININTADSATLQTLNGIGPSKAQAIIDYRTQHGAFQKIEDIMNVSGIGTATYNNIKSSISVGETASTDSQSQTSTTTSAVSTSTTSVSETTTSSATAQVSSYVAPPVPEIFADGGDDRTVIVGADTAFDGRAYNRDKKVLERVRFLWNFGDGTSADGPHARHHYLYPGRYAVVLTIAEDKYSVSDHFVVTAEPARLSFAVNGDGSVSIGNNAGRDLDLSGWLVRSFGRMFAMPENTIVLAGAVLRLDHTTLNFFAGPETEFAYPNGAQVLSVTESSAPNTESTTKVAPHVAQAASAAPIRIQPARVAAKEMSAEPQKTDISSGATSSAFVAAAALPAGNYWWFGAIGLALVAGGGMLAVRRFKKEEWDIIEQSE